MANKPAPIGKLSWKDVKKGLIIAALTGGLTAIAPAFTAGVITIATLQAFGIGAGTGLIAYLLKNLGTNSEDKFLTKEPE